MVMEEPEGLSTKQKAYRKQLLKLIHALQVIHTVDVPKLIQNINTAETIGPMIDPTLYRQNQKAMKEDKEMLKALLPAWEFGNKLKKDFEARK